jgi:hypothetical protein
MSVKVNVVDLPCVGQETTFSFDGHASAIIRLRKQWSAYYFNIIDVQSSFDETKLAVVISIKPHESYDYPDLVGHRVAFVDLITGDVQVCGYCGTEYLSGSYSGNGLVFATLSRPAARWSKTVFCSYRKSELGLWEFPNERTHSIQAKLEEIEYRVGKETERLQLSFDGTKVLLIDPTHHAASGRISVFNRVGFDYLLLQTLEPHADSRTGTWCKQFGFSHEYKIKDNGQRELLLVKNEEGALFKYELSASGFFKPL